MKQSMLLVLACSAVMASPFVALGQDVSAPAAAPAAPAATPPAPAPEYTATSNVYIVSDYYFRGQTQTWHKPALQGGFDLTHASGLYVGTWLSSISGNQFAGGSLEWDYYGGYNGKINDDFSWTVGGYGYYYPGADYNKASGGGADQSYNTFEGNVGVTWKWISLKFSHSFTDYFGANDKTGFQDSTKGTYYIDLSATYNIMDDLSIVGHVGRTHFSEKLASGDDPSYSDMKIGVTKTFKEGWAVGAAWVKGTNGSVYGSVASVAGNGETEDIVDSRVIVTVGRTF